MEIFDASALANRLDLYCRARGKALKWGRKDVSVRIV